MRYPGPFKPFAHQRETAEFLAKNKRAFCFNDIGTGKTHSAIWAMLHLMESGQIKKALIIAPLSTLNHVWARALFACFAKDVAVLTGAKARRWNLLQDWPDIAIINPDGLAVVAEHPWFHELDLIVIDESTAYKNYRTNRHKTLRKILKPETRAWLMSGSPMPQYPTDIWAQAKIVCPDAVHRTFGRFKEWSMLKVSQFKWVSRQGIEREIAERIAPYTIRFTRDECIDLPPVQYETVPVESTPDQDRIADKLKRDALAELEDGEITAINQGVYVLKLLQTYCGGVKYRTEDGETKVHWVNCVPKLNALAEIVEASEGPVLLFSPFKAPLILLKRYAEKKLGVPCLVVDGSTSQRDRDAAFDAVQENTVKILAAQPGAMSHGLTLTRSNTVVWWGLPYAAETHEQANGRIIRAGQTRKQMVYYLVSSPAEQVVLRRLSEREEMQGTLLEILAKD